MARARGQKGVRVRKVRKVSGTAGQKGVRNRIHIWFLTPFSSDTFFIVATFVGTYIYAETR
jgi:hypothetical protein